MIYIEPQSNDAAFHFSVEEYLMERAKSDEAILMLWQTAKTVMIGSNQVTQAEIDEIVVRENDIRVVRRRSGGGTIFTDPKTLLYTVILPWTGTTDTREIIRRRVAGPIVDALADMGVPAGLEGRNDILANGKKVSGLAQYIKGGRICSHGSLLYDADLDLLARVLRADPEKIRGKAIRSVRSRVANLKEFMAENPSFEDFKAALKERLFAANEIRAYTLTRQDTEAVHAIRDRTYGTREWTWDKAPPYSFQNAKRYPGGKLEVFLAVKRGLVHDCRIRGDFLGLLPIRELEKSIEGCGLNADALSRVLDPVEDDLPRYLGGLTKQNLMDCIFA
ncbi:MAG: lipoate--protein ligase [Clostridiales Family XIII bacterium]|jgi:lipoate-protein ligase A|nr:lipoate--protein ligase [Clostridiales Family XIII bacterium]